tara:strand:- start:18425 stop:19198 length:774 start_codon:yes stop_codon:yes gene_type:complete
MRNIRLIARLDIKAPYLVKGIQLEGLRKLGDPNEFARKYYNQGIDELYYEDIVASLFERNSLLNIIEETTKNIFIPVTVGGGIRNTNDAADVLRAGADKISINTQAIKNENIISELANKFGSSTVVLSIQAKKNNNSWEAYYDNGREHSYKDVIEWAIRGEELGAGEILLTSVDREGTTKGFDNNLIKKVTDSVSIPVIASGGFGKLEDSLEVIENGKADAIAMAHMLHYNMLEIPDIKRYLINKSIPIRNEEFINE